MTKNIIDDILKSKKQYNDNLLMSYILFPTNGKLIDKYLIIEKNKQIDYHKEYNEFDNIHQYLINLTL